MKIFIIFTFIFGFAFGVEEVVQLDQGKLTGSSLKSRNGREFKAFQGIPYAKSPTGDLRFKVTHNFLLYYIVILHTSTIVFMDDNVSVAINTFNLHPLKKVKTCHLYTLPYFYTTLNS